MTKTASKIRFRAKLFRPAATAKVGSWTFLTLPKDASAKLPSRGMTTVEGTINGFSFRATLEPDGQKSHWLRVNRKMREAAGADAGDVVTLEIAPSAEEPEPRCRQICGRLSRPPRKRGRCGRTSRPSRAEIGSTGSPPPSGQRLARVGSTMPARCSLPGSDAFAASIGLGSIVKASALLKRRFR
jgi:Domain of unknown function (DUF1905)